MSASPPSQGGFRWVCYSYEKRNLEAGDTDPYHHSYSYCHHIWGNLVHVSINKQGCAARPCLLLLAVGDLVIRVLAVKSYEL